MSDNNTTSGNIPGTQIDHLRWDLTCRDAEVATLAKECDDLRARVAEMERDKARIVCAFNTYIDLLVAELNDVVPVAMLHGWRTNRAEAGEKARASIDAAMKENTP